LTSQILSLKQKEITNYISITICRLLKNQEPPLCYACVLEHVNKLKSSPSLTKKEKPLSFFSYINILNLFPSRDISGYDFFSAAKISWNQMLNANECLWNSHQFKEIIVGGDFEVENGVLGLERDIYLSIVKFLDSSIVRKV
jgi:hypothetical protein